MAANNALRLGLRRTLSSFHRALSTAPRVASPLSTPSPLGQSITSTSRASSVSVPRLFWPQWSAPFSSSSRSMIDADKINPDEILFEGCDYNHWLITVDFPKDPKPTPEEMVRTYEEICAKGLGISIEEAKKKIYACSTTTYQGFQVLMTEEESEKFRDIPGVVFILPDSYIDPVNKEYGGDKYENGVITPRPPPVRYGREGGRFRDRNRNPNQPRYDRQGGQGYMQGDGRNYGASQSYPPHQNYVPQGTPQSYQPGQNFPPQQNYGQQGAPQNYAQQQSYGSQGAPQNYTRQQNYSPSGASTNYSPQQNFSHPEAPPKVSTQQNYSSPGASPNYAQRQNYSPPGASNYTKQQNYGTPSQGYSQGMQRNYNPQERGDLQPGEQRNYSPTYGQGVGGSYNQGTDGTQGQGVYPGYGQSYAVPGGGQNSYASVEHTSTDQGRY